MIWLAYVAILIVIICKLNTLKINVKMSKGDKGDKKKNTPAFLRNTYQMLEVQAL
jgi:hypothetical protein